MAVESLKGSEQYKGWLLKWTNYIKGYQRRWFVLKAGHLSYYRNEAESGNACHRAINVADIVIHTQESSSFVISTNDHTTFHLKASSEADRQGWIAALEMAKSAALSLLDSDEDDDNDERSPEDYELETALKTMSTRLSEVKKCHELTLDNASSLNIQLAHLCMTPCTSPESAKQMMTGFISASNKLMASCSDYVSLISNHATRWQKLVLNEHEQRLYLEAMVEQLSKQRGGHFDKHSDLKSRSRRRVNTTAENNHECPVDEENNVNDHQDDEDDFYDADDDDERFQFKYADSGFGGDVTHHSIGNYSSVNDKKRSENNNTVFLGRDFADSPGKIGGPQFKQGEDESGVIEEWKRTRRTKEGVEIPRRRTIPDRPNISINLWNIMKNCIGKELSKIPMPVNFNEPLSFMQRLTEDFEYSDCLDHAAACEDNHEQMAYVAAFTVSAYANTSVRSGKPFNPLLGETYECDRLDDLGWKSFSEQVSHHPPMVAMHTEGKAGWLHWQEFTMSSKFRGKYLQIIPLGIAHLLFPASGNHYTWRKVTTTVHNIILGRLWVDNHGEMDITNHSTGDVCHLKYTAYSYFARDNQQRKVTGTITDLSGASKYMLSGAWDDKLEAFKAINQSVNGKAEYDTQPTLLWQRRMPPSHLEKCYHFTQLAVELNDPEPDVAPTDSRNRPDQRLMEQACWNEANEVKMLLEEKQRATRKALENKYPEGYHHDPQWFKKELDEQTGNQIYKYNGEYWKCKEAQDWSRCPDIYLS